LAHKRLKTIRNVAVHANKPGAGSHRTCETPCGAGHVMAGSTGIGSYRAPKKLASA
jgi:hypothetical protein